MDKSRVAERAKLKLALAQFKEPVEAIGDRSRGNALRCRRLVSSVDGLQVMKGLGDWTGGGEGLWLMLKEIRW